MRCILFKDRVFMKLRLSTNLPPINLPRAMQALALASLLAASLFVSTVAQAGSFAVSPVRLYMTPKDRAIAVTLRNEGDTEVVLQAEINVWSQKADGTDELTPTDDLVLSPPIIKLPARGTQIVRLARLVPPDASRQLTYRMIIREVPEIKAKPGLNIPFALAFSLPVFITPPPAARQMACSLSKTEAKTAALTCANSGTAYAQTREVTLKYASGSSVKLNGGGYVLPGAKKIMPYTAENDIPSGAARLEVKFDDGKTLESDVDVR
jgi:fimbrial chaperone protein